MVNRAHKQVQQPVLHSRLLRRPDIGFAPRPVLTVPGRVIIPRPPPVGPDMEEKELKENYDNEFDNSSLVSHVSRGSTTYADTIPPLSLTSSSSSSVSDSTVPPSLAPRHPFMTLASPPSALSLTPPSTPSLSSSHHSIYSASPSMTAVKTSGSVMNMSTASVASVAINAATAATAASATTATTSASVVSRASSSSLVSTTTSASQKRSVRFITPTESIDLVSMDHQFLYVFLGQFAALRQLTVDDVWDLPDFMRRNPPADLTSVFYSHVLPSIRVGAWQLADGMQHATMWWWVGTKRKYAWTTVLRNTRATSLLLRFMQSRENIQTDMLPLEALNHKAFCIELHSLSQIQLDCMKTMIQYPHPAMITPIPTRTVSFRAPKVWNGPKVDPYQDSFWDAMTAWCQSASTGETNHDQANAVTEHDVYWARVCTRLNMTSDDIMRKADKHGVRQSLLAYLWQLEQTEGAQHAVRAYGHKLNNRVKNTLIDSTVALFLQYDVRFPNLR
jgi:hypothetical protein